ncbi:MAG: PD-(D/E)XK nuclease family protein [Flavobacteriales bacterium]|nr:MAG: PD-(D/E)XK nuclease family protein [Flavobacteriales bacterium]QQR86643.1 MAG: PD-(D/E)XK nuclease family protein [Flavobacteriales bacterium]
MSPLDDLAELLKELPGEDLPPRPDLFSISGYPHYEDVLSNWYSFFMDPSGLHGLGTMFLDTLVDLANAGKRVRVGKSMSIRREFTTEKGLAVDIIAHDGIEVDGRIGGAENAVIIENKVFHVLNNNLDDYLTSVPNAKKIGIVLCLKARPVGHPQYECITHAALMEAVVAQLPITYPMPEPYRQYLIDLEQNIHLLTENMEITDEVRFYLEHAERIQRVIALEGSLRVYLTTALNTAAQAMQMQLTRNPGRSWYISVHREDRAYVTVLLEDAFTKGTELVIVVEVRDEHELKSSDTRLDSIKGVIGTERQVVHKVDPNGKWIQFAPIRIPLTRERGFDLSKTIEERIKTDLLPVLDAARLAFPQ